MKRATTAVTTWVPDYQQWWRYCGSRGQGWVSAGRNLFLPDMRFKPEKPGSWYRTDMNSPEITGMSYSLTQSIYYHLVDLCYTLVYVIPYTNKI